MIDDDDNTGNTSEGEFIALGCVGLLGYSLVCAASIWTLHNCKSYLVITFLIMMELSGLLTFPWWFTNIIDARRLGLWQYSMFVVSRLIFVQAFCIISFLWASLLGRSIKIWNARLLFLLNIILIIVTGTALAAHTTWNNLHNLYASSSYQIFVIIEACIYLLLSGFLGFIGLRLLSQISTWSSLSDLGIKTQTFKKALLNLRIILIVIISSFLLQSSMLIVESLPTRFRVSKETHFFLSRRGFLWSLFHDILPRVVPAVTLMAFMKKNEAISNIRSGVNAPAKGKHQRSVVYEEDGYEAEEENGDMSNVIVVHNGESPMMTTTTNSSNVTNVNTTNTNTSTITPEAKLPYPSSVTTGTTTATATAPTASSSSNSATITRPTATGSQHRLFTHVFNTSMSTSTISSPFHDQSASPTSLSSSSSPSRYENKDNNNSTSTGTNTIAIDQDLKGHKYVRRRGNVYESVV